MAHNVVINGTTYPDVESVALRDSSGNVVMFSTIPELEAPGAATDLMAGKQLIDGNGNVVDGTFSITPELTEQDALIEQIKIALQGKAAGGGGSSEPDPREPYQRVEYIESAEEATYPYIITDFIADNSCGVEVIASFPTLVDRIPMGSRLDGNSTRFYCVYPLSASSIYYGFDTGVTISCKLTVNTVYRLQTNFLNSRLVNVYTQDGTRKGGGSISDSLTQQTAPVSIFGYNSASSGAVSSKREYKLYGARCSRGHGRTPYSLLYDCFGLSEGLRLAS